MSSSLSFAQRLDGLETSAIRELFKLLGKPGIISFAGGFPDASLFDVEGIRAASDQALGADTAGAVLAYGNFVTVAINASPFMRFSRGCGTSGRKSRRQSPPTTARAS